jgi:hypothetical protein
MSASARWLCFPPADVPRPPVSIPFLQSEICDLFSLQTATTFEALQNIINLSALYTVYGIALNYCI